MGLVKCPDCQRDVSDQAPVCIHCGRPKPGEQQKKPELLPAPKKRPHPDTVMTLTGAALLCAGLACLVAGLPGYAFIGMLAGLGGILLGGFWSWLKRE